MTMQMEATRGSEQSSGGNPVCVLYAKAFRNGKDIDWDLGTQDPPARGKARVSVPKGSGSQDIHIHLVAANGLKIDFDEADPIWVDEGTACPPPSGSTSDQISIASCSANLLKLHDSNTRACTLTYQLNFIGAGPCDPTISNGGTNLG